MNHLLIGLTALLLSLSTATLADTNPTDTIHTNTITVPVSQQSNQSIDTPARGKSMVQVEAEYGAPLEKFSAVGEPPITKWRYAGFTVYFEADIVIHSVINH